MPRKARSVTIQCQHFRWRLIQRKGIWYADGRFEGQKLGRHSLDVRDPEHARSEIHKLDQRQAERLGLQPPQPSHESGDTQLALQTGRELYEEHVGRPRITGGVRPATSKRYRAVLDKFLRFARSQQIQTWDKVDEALMFRYIRHLEKDEYAYRTVYLEVSTIKQILKWLIAEGHAPGAVPLKVCLKKGRGTDTYCWRTEEVSAMRKWCAEHRELEWLGHVITALASTGLRISELSALRWSDINFDSKTISVVDDTVSTRGKAADTRTTKNGRRREVPLHLELEDVLRQLPRSGKCVFSGPRGGRLKPDTIRRILIRDVLTPLSDQFPSGGENIGFADGRLHSFRHYFCSVCANSGVPEPMVMQWLGHQQSDMTRHYYHLHNDEANRRMQQLDLFGSNGRRSVDAEEG